VTPYYKMMDLWCILLYNFFVFACQWHAIPRFPKFLGHPPCIRAQSFSHCDLSENAELPRHRHRIRLAELAYTRSVWQSMRAVAGPSHSQLDNFAPGHRTMLILATGHILNVYLLMNIVGDLESSLSYAKSRDHFSL
jgi:hypothetical protein